MDEISAQKGCIDQPRAWKIQRLRQFLNLSNVGVMVCVLQLAAPVW